MRVLTLILILAISAQPLQAGYCAMGMGQGPVAGMDMPMDMDADMDHGDGHGCCETDPSGTEPSCQGGSHCGHCTLASPLPPSVARVAFSWHAADAFDCSAGVLLPSHSSPPFRPPIS